MENGKFDIAHDLLGDLKKSDLEATPGSRAEDRATRGILLRNGVSETDIARTLGLPEPAEADKKNAR